MSFQIGTITINRGIETTSTFSWSRPGMTRQTTASGSEISSDNGKKVLSGTLESKMIVRSEALALMDWITNTNKFGQSTFTITPDAYTDLGNGLGVAVTNAHFVGDATTEGILTPSGRLGKFDLAFAYRVVF